MSSKEKALSLISQGFHVFPLAPKKKVPAYAGNWHQWITNDPDIVPSLFKSNDLNVGIFAGKFSLNEYLVIVDVDVKDGSPGEDTFYKLDLEYGFPKTRTHRSPSGGKHYIYKSEKPYSGYNGYPGIEIICNGYVVGPGSLLDNGRYEVLDDAPVAPVPTWLAGKLKEHIARREAQEQAVSELDTPADIAWAKDYIESRAPEAHKGNRNRTLFRVAATLKDNAISEARCMDFIQEWNATKAFPQISQEEIAVTVASAYRNSQNKVGSATARADFEPIANIYVSNSDTDNPKATKRKLHFILAKDVTLQKDNPYLIKNVIDQEAMSVMYGDSNSGKTFVMLDLAYHIASGKPWQNRQVIQGAVVYVALEGGRGLSKRILALEKEKRTKDVPLAIVPCPVDLLRPEGDAKALVELVREAEKVMGQKVRLVVIDTLSRAMAGGNENAPEDMTSFVGTLDNMRNALKAHIAVVHHTGKDKARGARGHSSLRAATDTEIEIDAAGLITFTKQRDIEKNHPFSFSLKPVNLGVDSDGDPITSCVVEAHETSAEEDFKLINDKAKELDNVDREVLDVIELAVRETGNADKAITEETFIRYCEQRNEAANWSISKDKRDDRRRKQYRKSLAVLKTLGRVDQDKQTGRIRLV